MANKNSELIEGHWHSAYAKNIYDHHAIVDTACGCCTMAMVENMTLKQGHAWPCKIMRILRGCKTPIKKGYARKRVAINWHVH